MKRLLLPVFALFFSVIGLVESAHPHQFLQDDCCESLCPGAGTLRAADLAESFTPPQPAASGFARSLPFFAPRIVVKDIFHPPSVNNPRG
jgi:hypothetical protein